MGAFERITIDVPAETAEAMRKSVAEGIYGSADEIVDLALRDWIDLHASDERKLEWLRSAVEEGRRSGPGIPAEDVYAEIRARIAARKAGR